MEGFAVLLGLGVVLVQVDPQALELRGEGLQAGFQFRQRCLFQVGQGFPGLLHFAVRGRQKAFSLVHERGQVLEIGEAGPGRGGGGKGSAKKRFAGFGRVLAARGEAGGAAPQFGQARLQGVQPETFLVQGALELGPRHAMGRGVGLNRFQGGRGGGPGRNHGVHRQGRVPGDRLRGQGQGGGLACGHGGPLAPVQAAHEGQGRRGSAGGGRHFRFQGAPGGDQVVKFLFPVANRLVVACQAELPIAAHAPVEASEFTIEGLQPARNAVQDGSVALAFLAQGRTRGRREIGELVELLPGLGFQFRIVAEHAQKVVQLAGLIQDLKDPFEEPGILGLERSGSKGRGHHGQRGGTGCRRDGGESPEARERICGGNGGEGRDRFQPLFDRQELRPGGGRRGQGGEVQLEKPPIGGDHAGAARQEPEVTELPLGRLGPRAGKAEQGLQHPGAQVEAAHGAVALVAEGQGLAQDPQAGRVAQTWLTRVRGVGEGGKGALAGDAEHRLALALGGDAQDGVSLHQVEVAGGRVKTQAPKLRGFGGPAGQHRVLAPGAEAAQLAARGVDKIEGAVLAQREAGDQPGPVGQHLQALVRAQGEDATGGLPRQGVGQDQVAVMAGRLPRRTHREGRHHGGDVIQLHRLDLAAQLGGHLEAVRIPHQPLAIQAERPQFRDIRGQGQGPDGLEGALAFLFRPPGIAREQGQRGCARAGRGRRVLVRRLGQGESGGQPQPSEGGSGGDGGAKARG